MARRPWLDPLARRLLIATGQLEGPAPRRPSPPATNGTAAAEEIAEDREETLERELLALRLNQDPGLRLRDAAEVRRAAALGWRLDVNRATAADWRRLPGCRSEQIDLLLRLQAGGVQLSGPDDLQQLLGLDEQRLAAWLPLLSFQWYGVPAETPAPVAVNRATAAELEGRLGLSPERCRRLLGERARSPFRDLAELQQRLQLPAALVETWIGQVVFDPAPGGPVLPPTRRPER
jgi:hypothetical protein